MVTEANGRRWMTLAEVAALPSVVDLVTAGRALGIGDLEPREFSLPRGS